MFHVILRTNRELEDWYNQIKKEELPIKIYWDRILPQASAPSFRYLFGVVYKTISDYIGEPDITEIHKMLKLKFNVVFEPLPHDADFIIRIKSGSEWNAISLAEYVDKVSAWAAIELPGIYIPTPEES